MTHKIFSVFLLATALFSATALSQTGFEKRKARLLEVVSGEQETSFYTIAAKLRTGKDVARAYVMLDSMTADRAMGGMFYAYTLIGTYLYTRDVLPDSLHRKVREAYRVRTMYRGDTENH